MYDELTDESVFVQLPFQQQTELISRYCTGIQENILHAATVTDAQQIADEQCLQFQRSCSSEVLRNAITAYVHGLIRQTWHDERYHDL